MRIATLLNVHGNLPVVLDTIESIQKYMTQDILVIKDGALDHFPVPVKSLSGFYHACRQAPYRNVALGLKTLTDHYDADWYCYLEYDCLIGSNRFIRTLEQADQMDVWMLGSCGRAGAFDGTSMPLIESLIGSSLKKHSYYLLGCCQFMSRKFVHKLQEINFFDRFLGLTNHFTEGKFPEYSGYDISEHLYPTIARYFGGNIGVLSTFVEDTNQWHGKYELYPIRFRPELDGTTDNFKDASILHPLKSVDHPIRKFHKEKRKQCCSELPE